MYKRQEEDRPEGGQGPPAPGEGARNDPDPVVGQPEGIDKDQEEKDVCLLYTSRCV